MTASFSLLKVIDHNIDSNRKLSGVFLCILVRSKTWASFVSSHYYNRQTYKYTRVFEGLPKK